jgi:hypothetical protein
MAADAPVCCGSAQKHPPIVDLSNYEERKEEITQQLMDAATNSGSFPLCRTFEQILSINCYSLVSAESDHPRLNLL